MSDQERFERELQLEEFKAMLAERTAAMQCDQASQLEMLRATVSTGQAAVKTGTLINGGASVAVLAFLGTAWSSAVPVPAAVRDSATLALAWFVAGVFLAGFASAFAYLSQAGFGDEFGERSRKIGEHCRWVAMALCMASFVVFAIGAFRASAAFVPGNVSASQVAPALPSSPASASGGSIVESKAITPAGN